MDRHGAEMDTKITGTVENVVYSNEETGFGVVELDVRGESVTTVGELSGTNVGEELTVFGEYVNHPNFGLQFKAAAVQRILPSTSAAILKYLSNKAINGIGPALARAIVSSFGDETLEVIAKQPERLAQIKGISRNKAEEISQEFRQKYGLREAMEKLMSYSLDTAEAISLYRVFSDSAVELIDDNPYMLCGFPLYKDFDFSDAIALDKGFSQSDERRIRAAIIFILRHNLNNGHTCLPAEALIDKAADFLEIDRDSVEIALWQGVEDSTFGTSDRQDPKIFLSDMYSAEKYIAERISLLMSLKFPDDGDIEKRISAIERQNGIVYAELQREAIVHSLSSGVLVITGGPGTGKTTTLNAIIEICEQYGDKVMLCAPTGRAAKRLSELTNRNAKTIHRALEVAYGSGDELKFVHDENNPLKCTVVVIDEMSMVDVKLFSSLLRGIRPDCRLIMVGDSDQLPAVGAGNLLRDIIDSQCCPVIELQEIFRQAAQSLIIVNAHSIVDGIKPDLTARDRDFFFIKTNKEEGAKLVCDLVARRLPNYYDIDPMTDIQVLSPQRMGMMGTGSLNDALRERLNPREQTKSEMRSMGRIFRTGDRVMQVRNDYDIEYERDDGEKGTGVFNGDIGIVENVDYLNSRVVVRYDDRRVKYNFEQVKELEPAFAATVHKSQGSEFPAVVLVLCEVTRRLCYRNLLYTAVTRAKNLLVIVGDEQTVDAMVENDRKNLRYTGLKGMLCGE